MNNKQQIWLKSVPFLVSLHSESVICGPMCVPCVSVYLGCMYVHLCTVCISKYIRMCLCTRVLYISKYLGMIVEK